jgi:hypothetical protein
VLATLFFVTSLALAYLSTQRTAPTSLLESGSAAPTSQPAPATTPPPATSPAPAGELPTLPSAPEPAPEPANEKN